MIKLLGLISTLAGAVLTSLNIYPLNVILFVMGNIFYVIWAIQARDKNIATLQIGLILIYVVGFIFTI